MLFRSAGLRSATPWLRGELGRRLNLRRTPDLVIDQDRGLAEGVAVLSLLSNLEQERERRGPIPPGSDGSDGDSDDDSNGEP